MLRGPYTSMLAIPRTRARSLEPMSKPSQERTLTTWWRMLRVVEPQ